MSSEQIRKIVVALVVIALGAVSGRIAHHTSFVSSQLEEYGEQIDQILEASEEMPSAEAIRIVEKQILLLEQHIEEMQGIDRQLIGAVEQLVESEGIE